MPLFVMLKILLKQGRHNADWSIVMVMTCDTLLTSQILPVAITTQSNKPFLPETCCYVAMLSLVPKYFTVCIYFKVGSCCDLDVIVLCCQQYSLRSERFHSSYSAKVLSKSNNSFNNDNNNSNKHYLTVNVFSSKVLTDDLVFTSPIGSGAAILRAHPSQAKVQPFAGQRQYLHFSVIFDKTLRIDPILLG